MPAARVSIVIPHLNQPEFLRRCLNSLAPQVQVLGGVEVIVVDNGSKVLPTDVCSEFDWAILITEPTPGPGPARNRGISKSSAPLLAFIDADCIANENWLAAILAEFDGNPETLIVGGDVRIGREIPSAPTALEAYESVFAYRQKEYIEKLGFSGTGNLAMRRAAFDRVGPFAGIAVAEDRDWGRRATGMGLKIKYLANMIVYHPARKTIAELRKKWDRHISHDYEEKSAGFAGKLKWAGLTVAVAASGILDARKVMTSNRVTTLRERALASHVLLQIRLYRAGRMASQLVNPDYSSKKWNRS